jgi:hypothetical protein
MVKIVSIQVQKNQGKKCNGQNQSWDSGLNSGVKIRVSMLDQIQGVRLKSQKQGQDSGSKLGSIFRVKNHNLQVMIHK